MNKTHKNANPAKEPRIKVTGKFYDAETAKAASEMLLETYAHHPTITIWPIEDETYLPVLCSKDDEQEVQKALLELEAAKALTDPGSW